MAPGLRSGFWFVAVCAGLAGLFFLGAQSFAVGLVPAPYDKLAHALVFGCLFWALDRALTLPLWLGMAIALAASAADEVHQMWLPGREPSLADWAAGAVGVLLVAAWRIRHR